MSLAGRTHRRTLTGARFLGAAAAATAAAALVAGCTSGGSSSSSPATSAPASASSSASSATLTPVPVSSSPAASAPTTPATSSSPTGGVVGAAGTPACATRGLQATLGLGQGAAGSIYQVIDFKNISGAPCTLFGYPGVALAGGSPVTQIGPGATRSTAASATTVTLAAGATGNALLRITQAADYDASKCQPTTTSYLQIYPPNQTTPIYLAYKATACASASIPPLLSIGVVQSGSGG